MNKIIIILLSVLIISGCVATVRGPYIDVETPGVYIAPRYQYYDDWYYPHGWYGHHRRYKGRW